MTDRDQDILVTLCTKVRFFSLAQLARTWWHDTPREIRRARTCLEQLAHQGWLSAVTVFARPVVALAKPLVEWCPPEPESDFRAVSRYLRKRWQKPAQIISVYLASHRAVALFGGAVLGVVRHLCQTTHDLHVSEIFLHYRATRPDLAALWVGEDVLAVERTTDKRPDACLRDPAGKILRAIECGGAYKIDRLQTFHDSCLQENLPYEIW